MDRRDRALIDHYCDRLSSEINMPALWPRLIENKVFDKDDVNVPSWEGKFAERDTAREIILTIKTRGPRAYRNLILSLRQTDQQRLADVLEARQLLTTENGNDGCPDRDDSSGDPPMYDEWYKDLSVGDEPLRIVVRKATKFMDGPEYDKIGRYWMRSKPRGRVLLITNITSMTRGIREAAQHDEANLKELFEQMGFAVTPEKNLTGAQMKDAVQSFSRQDWSLIDSCFVIISAHGAATTKNGCPETEIEGTDYELTTAEKVYCSDIYDYFTAENCKHLTNKPKVFIFQACRGEKEQRSVKIVSDGFRSAAPPRNYSDMLIAHSTLPGCVAYRNTKSGSWYLQILCEVFMNHAYNQSLQDLFNLVDRRLMNLRTSDSKCQTSTVKMIGFNKHCFLNPGLFQNSDNDVQ